MTGKTLCAILLSFLFSATLPGAEIRPQADAARKLNGELLALLGDSMVTVDTFFKPGPGGEMPSMNVRYKCPNCNSYHSRGVEELIKERRPMRQPGFAVAPDEIIATDLYLIPEWLDRIEVVFRNRRYPAEITGFHPAENAVKLKLKEAPSGLKALRFEAVAPEAKLYNFFLVEEQGMPIAGVSPDSDDAAYRNLATGRDYRKLKPNTLLVDGSGKVVTITMNENFPLDADRLAPPSKWKFEKAAEREADLARLAAKLGENIYPIRLRLAVESSNTPQIMRRMNAANKGKNEFDGIAVKLSDGQLLVNLRLDPNQTARLDRIFVLLGEKMIDCEFVGSLHAFGALIVKPKATLPGKGLSFFTRPPFVWLDRVLDAAEIRNFDGKLRIRPRPVRVTGFETARDNVEIPKLTYSAGQHTFLFTPDDEILLLPLLRRDDFERYSSANPEPVPGEHAAALLASDRRFDANNIPRIAADRDQTAWLGVDSQVLTPELARDNNASKQTENGSKGLLITAVLPGSPAAKIGLKPGSILLYLRPADSQQRIELKGYEFASRDYNSEFPWEQYDQIPERYFDQIPTPWPPLVNELTNRLTKLGIGSKAVLGIVADGEIGEKELTLEKMPENYSNAPRYIDKNIGLTVVDPTFEVRNFFRMKDDDPGLVIAKIRPGSPASVAGLRPYEVILSVDDRPVKNVAEFETLVKDKKNFNFAVRRLAATRMVKFQLPSAD